MLSGSFTGLALLTGLAKASGTQRSMPLICKDTFLEQLEEANRGSSGEWPLDIGDENDSDTAAHLACKKFQASNHHTKHKICKQICELNKNKSIICTSVMFWQNTVSVLHTYTVQRISADFCK